MLLLRKIIEKITEGWDSSSMKSEEIKAVHSDDIYDFLKSLGEIERIESGEAVCFFCGDKISLNTISTIFPSEGEVRYCCNKDDCENKFMESR